MSGTMDWRGTWLQTVWLVVPRRLGQWQALIEAWSRSAMLDNGSAIFIDQDPGAMTYDSAQDPRYLPELRWSGTRSAIVAELCRRMPYRLELRIPEGVVPALRIGVIVNPDNSWSVSASVPLALFEDAIAGRRRFRRFVEMSAELFDPEVMFAGTVGEEAQLQGISSLASDVDRWTGRAFYGRDLLSNMPSAEGEAVEPDLRLDLDDGGLFISWAEWPRWEQAPPSWRKAVVAAIAIEVGNQGKPLP